MPKATFNDSENLTFELIPAGDYSVEVIKVDTVIATRPKIKGCDQFDIQVKVDSHPSCRIWDDLVFGYDKLQWKIDVFVKAMNFTVVDGKYNPSGRLPQKGEAFDMNGDDLIGLRGWVTIGIRDYENAQKEKKQINEIKVWLTDKPKLARNAPVVAAAAEDNDWKP